MVYLNSNRPLLVNSEIVEWDIKSANVSVIKEYGLLPDSEIKKISSLDKSKRVKQVGIIMRDNKVFAKELEAKFTDAVKIFIEQNSLDIDYDVLSIKKDAVFVISKIIKKPNIGNYITFVQKNTYHGYLQLHPYEFLFGNKVIDVKGISDELLPIHQNGILYLLNECMLICEGSNMNKNAINSFMKDVVEKYKKKELDFDFYREFNAHSKFRCAMYGQEVLLDNIDEALLQSTNIEYNYINIILPLIKIIC